MIGPSPISRQFPLAIFQSTEAASSVAQSHHDWVRGALGSVLGKITASGKYRLSPATQVVGDEGAESAVAVLIEAVDATAADKAGLALARGPAIVSKAVIVFDASVDQPAEKTAKHAQLAAAGIVSRDAA